MNKKSLRGFFNPLFPVIKQIPKRIFQSNLRFPPCCVPKAISRSGYVHRVMGPLAVGVGHNFHLNAAQLTQHIENLFDPDRLAGTDIEHTKRLRLMKKPDVRINHISHIRKIPLRFKIADKNLRLALAEFYFGNLFRKSRADKQFTLSRSKMIERPRDNDSHPEILPVLLTNQIDRCLARGIWITRIKRAQFINRQPVYGNIAIYFTAADNQNRTSQILFSNRFKQIDSAVNVDPKCSQRILD